MPLFLLTVFGKSQKVNLTKAERNGLKSLTAQIVETYSRQSRGSAHGEPQ
jgi:hypothetical protein